MHSARLIAHSVFINENLEQDANLLRQIAYTARVSNPGNQNNDKTDEGLIMYMIRNGHWSPFEMANITLEINTSRAIARQILRHRSFSFQEFSQRYASVDALAGEIYEAEARLQDTKNRQNSLENSNEELALEWRMRQSDLMALAMESYSWALDSGIAKEQARVLLPEGLTPSRMYMNGTVRSWIHYIIQRTDPTTQKEHRQVAQSCAKEISKVFPMIKSFVKGD